MFNAIKFLFTGALFIAITTACNATSNSNPNLVRAPTASATQPASGAPATPAADVVTAQLNTPFTIKRGQSATIPGTPDNLGILFQTVSADSRCPRQVTCAVPGEARIYIQPLRGVIPLPPLFELTTYPPSQLTQVSYGDYLIQLKDVQPYPERDAASKEISPEAYTATFIVSKPVAVATTTQAQPAPPVSGITAKLNEPFTLGLSQWATLADAKNTRIFFTNILEDTRCAIDISCFQAGNARVAITVDSNGKLGRFDLSERATDYRRVGLFNGYLVEFQNIAPARTTLNIPISPKDYRVTLRTTLGSLNVAQARLNEPFALIIGQTVQVTDADTRITFESVSQDSRCPTLATCATSGIANIVIVIERDGKTERLTLGTTPDTAAKRSTLFNTGGVYLNAVTPYPQKDFASKEISQNEYEATLVFVNYVAR